MRSLGAQNPVQLLATGPAHLDSIGSFTMLVVGMQFADGPGFAVLASSAAPGAELLLDATCEAATRSPGPAAR